MQLACRFSLCFSKRVTLLGTSLEHAEDMACCIQAGSAHLRFLLRENTTSLAFTPSMLQHTSGDLSDWLSIFLTTHACLAYRRLYRLLEARSVLPDMEKKQTTFYTSIMCICGLHEGMDGLSNMYRWNK